MFQSLKIKQGTSEIGCVALTPQLRDKLRSYGFDDARFNRFSHQIGASRFGSGEVLVTDAALSSMTAGGDVSLLIGDTNSPLEIGGLEALCANPLLVSNRGSQLFSMTLVDERYRSDVVCEKSYNMTRPSDRTMFAADTATDASTPMTTDEIVSELVTLLGWTVTVPDLTSETDAPLDVACEGRRAVETLDDLLGRLGYVLVPKIGGDFEIVAINNTTAADVVEAHAASVMGGSAVWGSSVDAFVSQTLPSVAWQTSQQPGGVDVLFARANATVENVEISKITGLSGTGGVSRLRSDGWAILDRASTPALTNQSEIDSRATLASDAYRQRYTSGALDVQLRGAVSVTPSAAAAEIEWRHTEAGTITRVRSRLHDPIRGWSLRGGVSSGLGAGAWPGPFGEVVIGSAWASIPAIVTARSASEPTAIESVTYSIEPLAGGIPEQTGVGQVASPAAGDFHLVRPGWPESDLMVTPAEVGTPCVIRPYPVGEGATYGTAYAVMQLAEVADSEECGSGGGA